MDAAALAAELLAADDAAARVTLPSERPGGLTMPQAFEVADALRSQRIARGQRPAKTLARAR